MRSLGARQMNNAVKGKERTFADHDIIVSKTDTRGIITYANDIFLKIADYTYDEVINKPHNIIRHPDMPKAVFKLLWDRLKAEQEIFAYVINRTKYGDYYWVFAHVTPTFDAQNKVIGYHSNRRSPKRKAVETIDSLYAQLRTLEASEGIERSFAALHEQFHSKNTSYDEFILSL
jgi:PAS domain S-box-containing protein